MPATAWMLLQTLWVGGIWAVHFIVLPGLLGAGFASLLVDEAAGLLAPRMVSISLLAVLLQFGVLINVLGFAAVWRDRRGQLLLTATLVALTYLLSLALWPDALRWQQFNYLLLAFFGLLLVVQPTPARVRAS